MSRKTRQEKIIADLRRRLEATRNRSEGEKWDVGREVRVSREELKNSPPQFPISQPTSHFPSSPSISTSYIKKDLTKTFLLTILAISLELVLYFLTRIGKI
ncbi:MAG: hypothetical protein ACOZBZ_01560 [Patescibacteria group bacterium]